MRAIASLIVVALSIAPSVCAASAPIPTCSDGLVPLSTVPPQLPPRLHNEFTGKAQVSFAVGSDGDVQAPAIVSSEWRPVGRSSGQPIGYDEAILAAVAQWRYPRRQRACRHQVPVEIQISASASAPAVGLTVRSSRNCIATPATWQKKLAMCPATRCNSA